MGVPMTWFRRDRTVAPAVRGSMEIREPWARPSSSRLLEAAGFVTVTNNGSEPDRLLGASSPAAASVELHAIKVVGANVQMRPLADGLLVHGGVTITLKPRGYHLLLQGLKIPPRTGSRLPVTLAFEKAGSIDIELQVKSPGPIGNATFDQPRAPG
jgi:copper(I)-binding protein